MKKIILILLILILSFTLFSCKNEKEINEVKLVSITDLTIENGLPTASALEEFYKDENYTYYFPTIRSSYIECEFSNGEKIKFIDALNSSKVEITDLDTFNISYYVVDKDGKFIK